MYSYISVITLLVFASIYRGESSKLGHIESLLKKSQDSLPNLASLISDNEKAIKQIKVKMNNGAVKTGNKSAENYINCWREDYEKSNGLDLYKDVAKKLRQPPEDNGIYGEEYPLLECVQQEASTLNAQSPSANCEQYRPSSEEQDIENLHQHMEYSYYYRMLYGKAILFNKIYETSIEKMKRMGGSN
ncbi:unnamed protein product [Trichobilharzia szidati]|nr:unnamed protein product [Trichobilharzia szidati]